MRRPPAYPLSIGMSAVEGLAFATVVTTNLVYQVESVGLNPLQLILIGTALEATVFAFEIPTGVVADVYSRRLSVVIGLALIGGGFVLEGSVPIFGALLIAQVVWGLGHTFVSGARTAWLADEVGAQLLPQALLRGSQANVAGGLAGAALSVALASIDRALPIIVGGLIYVSVALLAGLTMTENGFRPLPARRRRTFRVMGRTLREALKVIARRRALLLIVMVPLLLGAASEVPDRLSTPFLLQIIVLPRLGPLDPVAWFGLSSFVSLALTLGALEVVRRAVDTSNDRIVARVLMALQALYTGSLVAFGLSTGLPLALAMFWARGPLRRAGDPLLVSWQNRFAPSSVRATVLSIGGQGDSIGQVVGGPFLGAIALGYSLRAGFLAAAVVLIPVVILFAFLGRRAGVH